VRRRQDACTTARRHAQFREILIENGQYFSE
jgi:hypothetical protein